jgi:hypothetical protein
MNCPKKTNNTKVKTKIKDVSIDIDKKYSSSTTKLPDPRSVINDNRLTSLEEIFEKTIKDVTLLKKTQEEISKNLERVLSKLEEKHPAEVTPKIKKKRETDGQYLRRLGYKINYNLLSDRILSIAYKHSSRKFSVVYFTVRSDKDQFSRKKAHSVLREHIKYSTHKIFAQNLSDNKDFLLAFLSKFAERVINCPEEFPDWIVEVFEAHNDFERASYGEIKNPIPIVFRDF